MADAGFPGQHTTTTTVTSNTTVQTNLRFDPSYMRTKPGIAKAVQITLNLLGFICIQCSRFHFDSRGTFFNSIAMTGFWVSGILLAFYLFHVVEKFFKIPWLKAEFVFCAVWTLMYLIASSLAAAFPDEAYSAASFFGFFAMLAYGADAFLKFQAMQGGGLAQGERVVSKQTTSAVTTPHY